MEPATQLGERARGTTRTTLSQDGRPTQQARHSSTRFGDSTIRLQELGFRSRRWIWHSGPTPDCCPDRVNRTPATGWENCRSLGFAGFPVRRGVFGQLHAPFLTEGRTRGPVLCCVPGNPGSLAMNQKRSRRTRTDTGACCLGDGLAGSPPAGWAASRPIGIACGSGKRIPRSVSSPLRMRIRCHSSGAPGMLAGVK